MQAGEAFKVTSCTIPTCDTRDPEAQVTLTYPRASTQEDGSLPTPGLFPCSLGPGDPHRMQLGMTAQWHSLGPVVLPPQESWGWHCTCGPGLAELWTEDGDLPGLPVRGSLPAPNFNVTFKDRQMCGKEGGAGSRAATGGSGPLGLCPGTGAEGRAGPSSSGTPTSASISLMSVLTTVKGQLSPVPFSILGAGGVASTQTQWLGPRLGT